MTVSQKMFAEIHSLLIEFPELHRQANWETNPAYTEHCGTTRCVAGWAVWLGARDNDLLTRKREMTGRETREALADTLGLEPREPSHGPGDNYLNGYVVIDYPVLAAHLLGLSSEQAESLFHDMNNERVVVRVKSYAETGEDISDEESDRFED